MEASFSSSRFPANTSTALSFSFFFHAAIWLACTPYSYASSASVRYSLIAASATCGLNCLRSLVIG
jgi:hypothetical protein